MQKKLTCYYGLIERGTEGLVQEEISDALRLEPVVREILKRLDPELADVKIDAWSNWVKTIDAIDFGLGIIAARKACAVELAADIPVLPADQVHRWVWHAARTLWDSAHYRQKRSASTRPSPEGHACAAQAIPETRPPTNKKNGVSRTQEL